jgi:hypothetical protein
MERDNSVKIEVQGKVFKVSGTASEFGAIVRRAKAAGAKFDAARKVWVFRATWSQDLALAQFSGYTVVPA